MTTKDMTACENYRRTIAENPAEEGTHAERCPSCAAYRDELRALDAKLRLAMSLPVPDLDMPDLEEIDTNVVTTLPRRRMTRPAWLALAAAAAFAAVIGFERLALSPEYPSLADEIVAHLEHEPAALRVTDRAVSEKRLARVVPATIAATDRIDGLVTYAQSCVINGTRVPHLVIQGERGPVTILLMPGQRIDGAQSISGESIDGVILPVGDGSIAIVGPKGEDLRRIENNLVDSVSWSA